MLILHFTLFYLRYIQKKPTQNYQTFIDLHRLFTYIIIIAIIILYLFR